MAVKKPDLLKRITTEEKKMLEYLEDFIDLTLAEQYSPGKSVSISLTELKWNRNVIQQIMELYGDQQHGWIVKFESNQKEQEDCLIFQ
ncbi:MAG TPA: hypothetical protein P5080_05545 [Candidatus Paceibacterota bacterium]|nr:hypothetical protein [Candidatus Pacearchaeota archaeon]HRZ51410.1 hypothetical protein [Candidatus Paceibacterota bacterium]HSA37132.1 hypothetical protein [Candidatus Paceibacterota bacterium]